MSEYLFSYGTLQLERVQIENYGRLLEGQEDELLDYDLKSIEITDAEVLAKSKQQFHPIAVKQIGAKIKGQVFKLTTSELVQSDAYEVDAYKRCKVKLKSGINAWVYVQAD